MSEEIKEILENVKKCCEIMKNQSFVVYQKTDILKLLEYIQQLENTKKEVREILGEYKHYSVPDEIQNRENEEKIDKVLEILDKANKEEKKWIKN